MAAFSTEKLAGACLAHGLSGEGTNDELHTRLGHHLVNKLLSGKRKKTEEVSDHVQSKRSASASEWHAFMKSERANVVASGVQGRVPILKEIARRWKIFKSVGTSNAPLALPAPANDDLMEALKDLNEAELNEAIEAHGLDKTGSIDDKLTALAIAMTA